ncbi:MAG: hypothetical protein E5X05_01235 [Mesorhizobium sp.]|nr:MAG: hypothetical protein E5X05_01235 [Mesorhizobium sp.]
MLKIAITATGKTGEPKLREVAEMLVDQALLGEGWAIKEIADRIDGKVPQAVVGDDESDPISLVHVIERRLVRANTGN